jgi:hypothetical protein
VRLSRGCGTLAVVLHAIAELYRGRRTLPAHPHMQFSLLQFKSRSTYSSARNHKLNLSPLRANQLRKLLDDALKSTKPVVRSQRLEEVLHDAVLVLAANVLLQLGNDLLLVGHGERGRIEDRRELRVLLEDGGERVERSGGGVEGAGLDGCGVLRRKLASGFSTIASFPIVFPSGN